MNKVVLLGRLTKDPEVRYSTGEKETAVLGNISITKKDLIRNLD